MKVKAPFAGTGGPCDRNILFLLLVPLLFSFGVSLFSALLPWPACMDAWPGPSRFKAGNGGTERGSWVEETGFVPDTFRLQFFSTLHEPSE